MFQSNSFKYWLFSFLLSAAAVLVVGWQWFQVQRTHAEGSNVIKTKAELEKIIEDGNTIEFSGSEKPYLIPTGFFIQSLAFITASDVNITGYIWQKYPKDFQEEDAKGVVFPDEVYSEDTVIKKNYEWWGEQDGKEYQTIGWYFDVTLRQAQDYSNYPLDFLTVWIRIWNKDFKMSDRIIHVPDFSAYKPTGERTFGLDPDIVAGEWIIDETFFSYNDVPYDTDFGSFSQNRDVVTYKEFSINLGLKRLFINAFIINLVPLFVVALLLFAQMMIVTGSKDLRERFGFNTGATIATCSALSFVVILAHVQVRELFAGSGLVYIEYFYLIMYIVILLTALNSYIFSMEEFRYIRLIHYRDNLVVKVAYWPLVLWMMAVVTMIKL